MAFDWALGPIKYSVWAQHKILHQSKPKNIKIGKNFTWKWKKSRKFVWQLPDGIFFRGQICKLTTREVSNLNVIFKKWADKIFHLDSHKIMTDGRATDFFLFVKIGFSPIPGPDSSKKWIKKNCLKITKSILYIIITSFIKSKKSAQTKYLGYTCKQ
jgi:hypothetical protein